MIAIALVLSMISPMIAVTVGQDPNDLIWKPSYPDYAPSGVPDFDQKQDNWKDPATGRWSLCGPTAVANSLWWLDSEFEPGSTPPPTISDGFSLVPSWYSWRDDHDPDNAEWLIAQLASWMGWGTPGVEVHTLLNGLNSYLANSGMLGYFCARLVQKPTYTQVVDEFMRCQDVVLLLGFWQEDPPGSGIWYRTGGHYVTVAGANATFPNWIGISDPYLDAAEPAPHGYGLWGQVLPAGLHPHPPAPPDTVHNDALYVSHDMHYAYPSLSPGGLWLLETYWQATLGDDVFVNCEGQNCPVELQPYYRPYDSALRVHTEVEYALITCPWYAKGAYQDFAPSGMPDFDQKQDNWTNPWPPNIGSWSYCGPTSVANSLW